MPMKSIDLGVSYDEPISASIEKMEKKKHYPTLRIEGDEKLELPEEGTMTVHFHKVASESSERDGKKHYSCTLEVKHILSVKADDYEDDAPTKKSSRGAEEALDALMKERMEKKGEY